MGKKVFAFDLGKASIGYCAREDHNIKEANSIIIEKDHGEIASNRNRRRIKRTLLAHKAREIYFNKIWLECGQTPLDNNDIGIRFIVFVVFKYQNSRYNERKQTN